MRTSCAKVAAVAGVCLLLATGCASSRAALDVVHVRGRTPAGLAALLQRPVRVPARCDLTRPVYLKGWGYSVGRPPLRAILNARSDSPRQSFQGRLFHGWWYAKVVWFEPSTTYHGWLLVRGVGLNRSPMGFLLDGSEHPRTALELHTVSPPQGQSSLAWPTATLVPHGGCYAYQVDGRSFSYSIIVRAYR